MPYAVLFVVRVAQVVYLTDVIVLTVYLQLDTVSVVTYLSKYGLRDTGG